MSSSLTQNVVGNCDPEGKRGIVGLLTGIFVGKILIFFFLGILLQIRVFRGLSKVELEGLGMLSSAGLKFNSRAGGDVPGLEKGFGNLEPFREFRAGEKKKAITAG